jgi:hypothetical protein
MHYTKFLQPHKCWDSTGSRNTTKASSCRKGATLVNLAHQWNRQLCNAKGHSAWVRVLSIRNGRHLENEQDSELKRLTFGRLLAAETWNKSLLQSGFPAPYSTHKNRQLRHWNSCSASVPVPWSVPPWIGTLKLQDANSQLQTQPDGTGCLPTMHAVSTPNQLQGQWIQNQITEWATRIDSGTVLARPTRDGASARSSNTG